MLRVIAIERGVKIAEFPTCQDVNAALEKWCRKHGATVALLDVDKYGQLAATVELPDGIGRRIEFVQAVG